MKNCSYHSNVKQCPYKAVFGCPVKISLEQFLLPPSVSQHIRTEEELENVMKNATISTQSTIADAEFPGPSAAVKECACRGSELAANEIRQLCNRRETIGKTRKASHKA